MSEKFTPGPWRASFKRMSLVTAENGAKIAVCEMLGGLVLLQANQMLIASAPDLYDDLKAAAAQLRKYEELHRAKGTEESLAKAEVNAELASRFEATLAKARGEV